MPRIFVSYRREDTSGYAGRLFDRLSGAFGKKRVFMDVGAIGAGADFVDTIDQAVGNCEVFIALIGPGWLDATDAQGARRIDDKEDFVRAEVASALAREKVEFIPVLVQGAKMPAAGDLPGLEALTRRNALELSDTRWDFDVNRLIDTLAEMGAKAGPGQRLRIWLRRRRKALAAAAALALLLATGYAGLKLGGTPGPSEPGEPATLKELVAAATPRPSVAVLGFENITGRAEDAWLSTALSEALNSALGAGEGLRTTEGGRVAEARNDLGLESGGDFEEATWPRIQQYLGTDYAILGSFTRMGGGDSPLLRVDLRFHDVVSGEILEQDGETGTGKQLFELLDRAARTFRGRAGVRELTQTEKLAVMASLPSDPRAARPYAEALKAVRRYDCRGARSLLDEAVEAEPEHPLPHSLLARAYTCLGFPAEATKQAATAFELSEHLSVTQRSVIEATYHETAREFDRAGRIYLELLRSHPDDLELGLRLALTQIQGGFYLEALATVEALRELPASSSQDPRLDLVEAHAQAALGEVKRAAAIAAQAAARASELGASHLVAEARLVEASALQDSGSSNQAGAALEEARGLFEALGNRIGAARTVETMAHSAWAQGDLIEALLLFERARATYREQGSAYDEARCLQTEGNIYLDQGRLVDAERVHQQALEVFRDLGDKLHEANLLNAFGYSLHVRGDLEAAEANYTESLEILTELGRDDSKAVALNNIGEIRFTLGHLAEARSFFEEARSLNQAVGDKLSAAYNAYMLGQVLAASGDLVVAARRLESAMASQEEMGANGQAALTRWRLAEIKLLAGESQVAERLASEAEETLRVAGEEDQAALALTVLTRALLAQGRLDEARKVAQGFDVRVKESEDRELHFAAAVASARLTALSSQAPHVVADLARIAEEAEEAGFIAYAFEARLAAGEIEIASGRAADGRARLEALAAEASSRGFGLFSVRSGRALAG